MSVLLFVVGAIITMAGVGMAGYGIPINEFSFGNTLIIAGTTATVGGLIIIAIGIAVGQLRRIAETLATLGAGPPLEMFVPPAGSRAATSPGQIPFPPRPNPEPGIREPEPAIDAVAPADRPDEDRAAAQVAPTLQNPDLPAVAVERYEVEEYEDVSLSPQQLAPAPAPADLAEPAPASVTTPPAAEKHAEPAFDAPWRSSPPPPDGQPHTSYFDAMWPAEPRPATRRVADEPQREPPPSIVAAAAEPPNSPPTNEPVAILKSGVVDGMGYTLYVDGSIEAELPQGTLRFASINDLRNHLAKNP